MLNRHAKIVSLVTALVLGPIGVAYAGSGSYVPSPKQITFYYDLSSGDGNSYRSGGSGTSDKLCMDAPGSTSSATFVGEVKWHRTILRDPTMKSGARAYADPSYVSSGYTSQTDRTYYARATWNYAGNLPGQPSGYSKICG